MNQVGLRCCLSRRPKCDIDFDLDSRNRHVVPGRVLLYCRRRKRQLPAVDFSSMCAVWVWTRRRRTHV